MSRFPNHKLCNVCAYETRVLVKVCSHGQTALLPPIAICPVCDYPQEVAPIPLGEGMVKE